MIGGVRYALTLTYLVLSIEYFDVIRSTTSKFGQFLSSSWIWEKRGLKGELAPRAPVLPRFYRYGAQPETLEKRYTGAARKRAQRGGAPVRDRARVAVMAFMRKVK
jgi:hypothetical protein